MSTPFPLSQVSDPHARHAFAHHPRIWQANRYVYPVVSRRSKGISLGINLNPDKACNFDCIYCSVDRSSSSPPTLPRDIDLPTLHAELSAMLDLIFSGNLYQFDPFDKIPPALRRLNDIAFSGDGEPTTCPQFDAAVRLAAQQTSLLPQPTAASPQQFVKLVLITNATMFQRPAVRETLAFLDSLGQGAEIWAKLDAGTADYYHLVDRTNFPFPQLLDNLAWSCQTRPTVIQSLFMRVHGNAPPPAEITAYVERLVHLTQNGGRIKLVQLYTVARRTTEAYATALSAMELEQIAGQVRSRLPDAPVEVYP